MEGCRAGFRIASQFSRAPRFSHAHEFHVLREIRMPHNFSVQSTFTHGPFVVMKSCLCHVGDINFHLKKSIARVDFAHHLTL